MSGGRAVEIIAIPTFVCNITLEEYCEFITFKISLHLFILARVGFWD